MSKRLRRTYTSKEWDLILAWMRRRRDIGFDFTCHTPDSLAEEINFGEWERSDKTRKRKPALGFVVSPYAVKEAVLALRIRHREFPQYGTPIRAG